MRIATALLHSSRKTRSTSGCTACSRPIAGRDGSRSRPLRRGGMSAASRIASSRSGRSMRNTPPRISFVSANGPSVTSRSPSRTWTTFAVLRPSSSLPTTFGSALPSSSKSATHSGISCCPELRLLLVGEVDPPGVVAVDEQCVVHSCTSSGSTYTGRTSTAPCSAPGMRAAQSSASSIDSHSSR